MGWIAVLVGALLLVTWMVPSFSSASSTAKPEPEREPTAFPELEPTVLPDDDDEDWRRRRALFEDSDLSDTVSPLGMSCTSSAFESSPTACGVSINPANGLPMVGCVDVEGNPYGTDFSHMHGSSVSDSLLFDDTLSSNSSSLFDDSFSSSSSFSSFND